MLKSLFEKYKGDKKTRLLIFIGVVGIALLFSANSFSYEKEPTAKEVEGADIAEYRKTCEKELSEIIKSIKGVDNARVMITFSDSGKTEYLSEEKISLNESDNSVGQDRESTAAFMRENGDEAPVVVRRLMPEAKGVAVVADGEYSRELELKISNSVKSALGIGANKISIIINERNR